MDINGFKRFLEARKLSQGAIDASVASLQDFETNLKSRGKEITTATRQDLYDYSARLINAGKNIPDSYISILRYAYFKKLKELIVAGMEVLDGSEVIENFSNRLVSEFSQELRDYIFESIGIPPLGISPKEKPEYTKKLVTRLVDKIGAEECVKFLNRGLRDRYEESRKPDREKFLKSKNIDEFLKQKHKDFVVELERHFKKIIIKKIPHMAKEYLAEKDERKKRYYYCHCPWVKEAFEESDKPISPVFCSCSAGFYRAYWEIVFDQPVQVDVLASLLNGDPICKFAVHIPDNVTTG